MATYYRDKREFYDMQYAIKLVQLYKSTEFYLFLNHVHNWDKEGGKSTLPPVLISDKKDVKLYSSFFKRNFIQYKQSIDNISNKKERQKGDNSKRN